MRQPRFERGTFGSGGGDGQRQPATAPLLPLLLPRGIRPWPGPRLPDDGHGADGFDRCEEQVLRQSGRPAPPDQGRNEGQETVDQGHDAAGDDIRQPVRPKWKQSRGENHRDGYFHQYRRTREGQLPEVRSVSRWRAKNGPQGNNIRIQVVEQREDPQYRQTLSNVGHINLRVREPASPSGGKR